MEITKIITTKGVCRAQHDTTAESQQGLPPEPVVLQSSLIRTRGSVGWACVAHLSFCFEET
jgi:hypothetical protein